MAKNYFGFLLINGFIEKSYLLSWVKIKFRLTVFRLEFYCFFHPSFILLSALSVLRYFLSYLYLRSFPLKLPEVRRLASLLLMSEKATKGSLILKLINLINKHILDQSTSNEFPLECPFLNLRHTHKKREFGKLSSMTWFLRVGATGFEPAT